MGEEGGADGSGSPSIGISSPNQQEPLREPISRNKVLNAAVGTWPLLMPSSTGSVRDSKPPPLQERFASSSPMHVQLTSPQQQQHPQHGQHEQQQHRQQQQQQQHPQQELQQQGSHPAYLRVATAALLSGCALLWPSVASMPYMACIGWCVHRWSRAKSPNSRTTSAGGGARVMQAYLALHILLLYAVQVLTSSHIATGGVAPRLGFCLSCSVHTSSCVVLFM